MRGARRRGIVREHPAVTQRRSRALMSSQIQNDEQRARFEHDFPESELLALPKVRGPRVDHADLEKHVLSAVGDLLVAHPKVLLAVRQNTGGTQYEGSDGRAHSMWFYRLIRTPDEMTITDYWGFLRDGRPMAIECKKPSWKWSGDEREKKQRAFIHMIESIGGVGGFVRGVDETMSILP